MTRICVCACLLFLTAAHADSLDYSTWTVKVATVQKSGDSEPPNGTLTARALTVLHNSYYDDMQTVIDYLLVNPKVGRKLDRLHLTATKAGSKFLSDGTVTNEYELPLAGVVLQSLMPRTGGGVPVGPMACPICGQPWPEGREVPSGVTLVPLEENELIPATGVLIDARGIDLNPALFPRIVNEDGRTIYGPEFFVASYAAERGAVGYYDNPAAALTDERLGYNPVRIAALRAAGRNSTNIVISNGDALRLHGSVANLKLLERCRVVILTD